jgi:hypothetical protein
MRHRWTIVAAAIALALPLGGCKGIAEFVSLPVGTCVRADEAGTTPVPCADPHTHKVIAIAPTPEGCPVDTSMAATPADPDDGTTTTCFRSDTGGS